MKLDSGLMGKLADAPASAAKLEAAGYDERDPATRPRIHAAAPARPASSIDRA